MHVTSASTEMPRVKCRMFDQRQALTDGVERVTSSWGEETASSSFPISANWTPKSRSLSSLGCTIKVERGLFSTIIPAPGVYISGWLDAARCSSVLQSAERVTLPPLWLAKLSSVADGNMWELLMTTQPERPSCSSVEEWLRGSVLEEYGWLQIIPSEWEYGLEMEGTSVEGFLVFKCTTSL